MNRMHDCLELVRAAYAPLVAFADDVDDDTGWAPTRLPGWCVRDLLFHLAADCQRALVAFGTPSELPADTDEVTYWAGWQPGTPDARSGLRGTRIIASAWSTVRGPADLFADTARAVLVTAARVDPNSVVTTQGHRLAVDALLRTLAVEATIHHLDLADVLDAAPAAAPLAEVRRVLDGLLGEPAPAQWSDERYARVATGRDAPSDAERDQLGPLVAKLPLFG
jgi:hypothetical protein